MNNKGKNYGDNCKIQIVSNSSSRKSLSEQAAQVVDAHGHRCRQKLG